MINSAKDYDLMMFKILINIQQGNYTQKDFDFSISESTYLQLMSHLIDYNYVEGFRLISLLGGSGIKARNPKLTREGLTFINNYLIDNLLMELVRRAQSKGIEKASIFINE
ncbi:YjcQ family protein, partial [Paenibacillus larvae]